MPPLLNTESHGCRSAIEVIGASEGWPVAVEEEAGSSGALRRTQALTCISCCRAAGGQIQSSFSNHQGPDAVNAVQSGVLIEELQTGTNVVVMSTRRGSRVLVAGSNTSRHVTRASLVSFRKIVRRLWIEPELRIEIRTSVHAA